MDGQINEKEAITGKKAYTHTLSTWNKLFTHFTRENTERIQYTLR